MIEDDDFSDIFKKQCDDISNYDLSKMTDRQLLEALHTNQCILMVAFSSVFFKLDAILEIIMESIKTLLGKTENDDK